MRRQDPYAGYVDERIDELIGAAEAGDKIAKSNIPIELWTPEMDVEAYGLTRTRHRELVDLAEKGDWAALIELPLELWPWPMTRAMEVTLRAATPAQVGEYNEKVARELQKGRRA